MVNPNTIKKHSEDRASLVQYLCRCDMNHYLVYNVMTQKVHKCRIVGFQCYSPYSDPDGYTPAPIFANKSILSDAPRSLKEAQRSDNADKWEQGYNSELESFEKAEAIKWVHKSTVPTGTKVLPMRVVYREKTNEHGEITKQNVRINVRGDLQVPYTHYNPNEITSPVA